jgi:hypothetical protein
VQQFQKRKKTTPKKARRWRRSNTTLCFLRLSRTTSDQLEKEEVLRVRAWNSDATVTRAIQNFLRRTLEIHRKNVCQAVSCV